MSHDPLAEWEQLQTQLTAIRRQWLQSQDSEKQKELYDRLLVLQKRNMVLEQSLRTPSAVSRESWWPVGLLVAIALLPLLVIGVLMAKYWVNEWALQRLFAQTPPLADLVVTSTNPLQLNNLGIEIQLEMEWIGRLEVARLTFKSITGTTETHPILGGEVLPLPLSGINYFVHIQQIDYEAKMVKLTLFQEKSARLTKIRQAKAISNEKRRWSTLTSNSV